MCCKPELQMVLEKRKREQTQREEGEQSRSPLEQVLQERQHKHQETASSSVCVLKTNQTNAVIEPEGKQQLCSIVFLFFLTLLLYVP